MSTKTKVFITGATGNMGWAAFQELYSLKENLDIRLLARPSKKNKKLLKNYLNDEAVTIIWGDLTNYDNVLEGVNGSDYVFHIGGMVSPAADYFPEKTLKTNITAAENIVKAIRAQKDPDNIKCVYIGSVAEYGNRMGKYKWGRAGDPMRASQYDMYSVSKCKSEKIFIDGGLNNWLVLRQSGILYPGILKVLNPTAFHVPLQGVLEWATIEDSGRLIRKIVETELPEEFWNNIYNISSGEEYRMTNYEFEKLLLNGLGLPSPEKVFEPQWFATRNFHGMWYTDADKLEDFLHFRANTPVKDYFASMKSKLPWFYSLAFLAPAFAVKWGMKPIAYEKGMGTQWWVKNDIDKINAYYGSLEEYKKIKSWGQMIPPYFEKNQEKAEKNGDILHLSHGWDESKSIYDLSLSEIEAAAEFRGGKFIGPAENLGKKGAIFEWECEHGHHFKASLEFVLLAGGWCIDECHPDKWEQEVTPANEFGYQVR